MFPITSEKNCRFLSNSVGWVLLYYNLLIRCHTKGWTIYWP